MNNLGQGKCTKKKLIILNVNCHISFRVLLKKLQVELRKIEEKFLCRV